MCPSIQELLVLPTLKYIYILKHNIRWLEGLYREPVRSLCVETGSRKLHFDIYNISRSCYTETIDPMAWSTWHMLFSCQSKPLRWDVSICPKHDVQSQQLLLQSIPTWRNSNLSRIKVNLLNNFSVTISYELVLERTLKKFVG